MFSRIEQTLIHPRTGEKMYRVIVDPRGINLSQYRKIDLDAVRSFGSMNVVTKGTFIRRDDDDSKWTSLTTSGAN